ncbi:MAG TPA: hypothetical protein DDY39_18110, partial [Nitrospira sp.]|nr:hypothetical protein [Nitrospira sp.]
MESAHHQGGDHHPKVDTLTTKHTVCMQPDPPQRAVVQAGNVGGDQLVFLFCGAQTRAAALRIQDTRGI